MDNKGQLKGIEEFTTRLIKRFDLRYYVSNVPHSKAEGWDDWSEDNVYFKIESQEFPSIRSYSANNKDVI